MLWCAEPEGSPDLFFTVGYRLWAELAYLDTNNSFFMTPILFLSPEPLWPRRGLAPVTEKESATFFGLVTVCPKPAYISELNKVLALKKSQYGIKSAPALYNDSWLLSLPYKAARLLCFPSWLLADMARPGLGRTCRNCFCLCGTHREGSWLSYWFADLGVCTASPLLCPNCLLAGLW